MLESKIRKIVNYSSEDGGLSNFETASSGCVLALHIWRWNCIEDMALKWDELLLKFERMCIENYTFSQPFHYHFNVVPTIDSSGSCIYVSIIYGILGFVLYAFV
jgi:hypothetical protein